MKTKSLSRLLALLLSVLMVLSMTACGSKKTENPNAIGHVSFTIDETKLNIEGKPFHGLGGARVEHNKIKLHPGQTFYMDPTINLDSSSHDSWLFVRVVNGVEAVESQAEGYVPVADQLTRNGWVLLKDNLYTREAPVGGSEKVVVFNEFTLREDVTEDELKALETPDILVTPYAVEAEDYDTAEAAWEASGFGA